MLVCVYEDAIYLVEHWAYNDAIYLVEHCVYEDAIYLVEHSVYDGAIYLVEHCVYDGAVDTTSKVKLQKLYGVIYAQYIDRITTCM